MHTFRQILAVPFGLIAIAADVVAGIATGLRNFIAGE